MERPVIRQVVSVACGPEQSGTPQDVATQTRRAFCIGSSSSSEGELGATATEGPMETGGSSVEAVVGAADPPETSDGNVESSVSVVGSPLVGSAVASIGRVLRSGKLNSFNDHVIHCYSDLLLLPSYLGCYLKFVITYASSVVCFGQIFLFFLFVSFQWRFCCFFLFFLCVCPFLVR